MIYRIYLGSKEANIRLTFDKLWKNGYDKNRANGVIFWKVFLKFEAYMYIYKIDISTVGMDSQP